jgi:hypothetical protein
MSAEFWKSVFDWGTVVLAGLTFVFGGGALITGKILSDRQDEQLRQFDKGLTSAKTELGKQQVLVDKANAVVAALEKDAADAKAEMAKQQTRAADAERSLLELQTRLAHRRISPDQQAKMVTALLPYAGSSVTVEKQTEAESAPFADDILAVLSRAKWNTRLNLVGNRIPPLYGLQCIIDTRSEAGRTLADILRSLPTSKITEAPSRFGVGTIQVGLKPPA